MNRFLLPDVPLDILKPFVLSMENLLFLFEKRKAKYWVAVFHVGEHKNAMPLAIK